MMFSIDRIVPVSAERSRNREEQMARIDELRRRAAEAAGGEMTCYESADMDPDIQEAFWARVVAFEEAPARPLTERLGEAGVEVPPAGELDDEALHRTLWRVIEKLAEWKFFLCHTNHLNDRALYSLLQEEVLAVPEKELPLELSDATLLDMPDYASDEQYNTTYLRYYADEEERAMWEDHFPEDGMPAHEDPPYTRDAKLPAPPELE